MGNNVDKPRIQGVDFTRLICSVGIVLFHYDCHSATSFKVSFANGYWGYLFVTVFFVMSGFLLYYNNQRVTSLKVFYKKRFFSIFPIYWVAYWTYYLYTAFSKRQFFWSGHPLKILKSIIGMDGYFHYLDPSDYYILGEWFLGAIIVCYIIYPLLAWLINKHPIKTTIGICILFGFTLFFNWFPKLGLLQNPISFVFSFWIGMLFIKYKNIIENKYVQILAFLILIVGTFVHLNSILAAIIQHISGFALFTVLCAIGSWLTKAKMVDIFISKLASLSYPVFLIQHIVIVRVLAYFNPTSYGFSLVNKFLTIIICFVGAKILQIVTQLIVNLFKKAET